MSLWKPHSGHTASHTQTTYLMGRARAVEPEDLHSYPVTTLKQSLTLRYPFHGELGSLQNGTDLQLLWPTE